MSNYPVTFAVEYPEHPLSRLTTALRMFIVIPILMGGTGLLFLPPLLMIVFPEASALVVDWNLELLRFTNRVGA